MSTCDEAEAENVVLQQRLQQAEQALTALKTRRCETCDGGENLGDISQLTICHTVKRFSNTNSLVVPYTHYCRWWTPRKDG